MSDEEVEVQESRSILPWFNLILQLCSLAGIGFIIWQLSLSQPLAEAGAKGQSSGLLSMLSSDDGEHALEVMSLDDFTVNLSDTDNSRFLRCKIKLQVENSDVLNRKMDQVRDLVITVLSSKTFSQLNSPIGKGNLKEELMFRLNKALGAEVVHQIYFTSFVSQ